MLTLPKTISSHSFLTTAHSLTPSIPAQNWRVFPLCHQLLGSKTHLPTEPTWSKAMCSAKNNVSHTPSPREDGDQDAIDKWGFQKSSLKGQSGLEEMLMCSPVAATGMDSNPVSLTGTVSATLSLPFTSRLLQRRMVKHDLAQGTTVQIFCYTGLNLTLFSINTNSVCI